MPDRAKAKEYAYKFAKLYVELGFAKSLVDAELTRQYAQALYDEMRSKEFDFSTAEMRITLLLWELKITPDLKDSLWTRTDSPWCQNQPKSELDQILDQSAQLLE